MVSQSLTLADFDEKSIHISPFHRLFLHDDSSCIYMLLRCILGPVSTDPIAAPDLTCVRLLNLFTMSPVRGFDAPQLLNSDRLLSCSCNSGLRNRAELSKRANNNTLGNSQMIYTGNREGWIVCNCHSICGFLAIKTNFKAMQ